MVQLSCIGLSWPRTNRHLLEVASHLFSPQCTHKQQWLNKKHIHPRSWWLENDLFLLGPGNFSVANSLLNFGRGIPWNYTPYPGPSGFQSPPGLKWTIFRREPPFFEPPGFIRINPSASTAGPSKVARTDGLTKVGFSWSQVSGDFFFALFFGVMKKWGRNNTESQNYGKFIKIPKTHNSSC